MDNFDIVFIDEAEALSEDAWDTIEPTVRKPGSKIILNFNPHLPTDIAWRLYQDPPQPERTFRNHLTYRDNHFNSEETLNTIRADLKSGNPKKIAIWNGTLHPASGGMFTEPMIHINNPPDNLIYVTAVDWAATQDDGDYTVFVRMGMNRDDKDYYITDVVRGQWEPATVN